MKEAARNDTLDAIRLLCMVYVVAIHVELYQDLGVEVAAFIRLTGRWVFPFFFILTGYHLGPGEQSILQKSPGQSARLYWIFWFASLLYVPAVLLESGVRKGLSHIFSLTTFVYGTEYDLWFLNSMFVGLQIIYAAYRFGLQRYLPVVAVLLIVSALAAGSYSPLYGWDGLYSPQFVFFRHLLSVSFIWVGLALGRRGQFLSLRACVLLTLAGLLLELLEAHFLDVYWGMSPMVHEFLIGSIPFGIGMFGIGLGLKWNHCRWIADWGRKFSLGIYIVHLWWATLLADAILRPLAARGVHVPSLVTVALIFGLSLGSLMSLERFFPPLLHLLNGRFEALKRAPAQSAGL